MKKHDYIFWASMITVYALVIFLPNAHAAPFCVADVPDIRCDTCVITASAPLTSQVVPVSIDIVRGLPANGNRICSMDCAAATVGVVNNITFTCRDSMSVWGDSPPTPFSFARSAPPGVATGTRVAR